jgi:drug/metabolite transporter (DMT)-like permease
MSTLGIIFALGALLSWGIGDFFIQKTCRVLGSWKALFLIGIVGTIILLPFVKNDIGPVFSHWSNILLLLTTGLVVLTAALFDFEALRQGKIAIIEPVISLELPVTIALSVVIGKERLTPTQYLLAFVIFLGVMLAITEHHSRLHYHKRIFEKGVIIATLGAIGMALTNFLMGVSSQQISPLFAVWFTWTFFTCFCLLYLILKGEVLNTLREAVKNYKIVLLQGILDTGAWLFYSFAITLIPISITTAISESYVALAAVLGVFVNKEKLKRHQIVGIILAITSVVILATTIKQ